VRPGGGLEALSPGRRPRRCSPRTGPEAAGFTTSTGPPQPPPHTPTRPTRPQPPTPPHPTPPHPPHPTPTPPTPQGRALPDVNAAAQRRLAAAAHQRRVQPQLHDHVRQLQVSHPGVSGRVTWVCGGGNRAAAGREGAGRARGPADALPANNPSTSTGPPPTPLSPPPTPPGTSSPSGRWGCTAASCSAARSGSAPRRGGRAAPPAGCARSATTTLLERRSPSDAGDARVTHRGSAAAAAAARPAGGRRRHRRGRARPDPVFLCPVLASLSTPAPPAEL
jgi:hypothetical protein